MQVAVEGNAALVAEAAALNLGPEHDPLLNMLKYAHTFAEGHRDVIAKWVRRWHVCLRAAGAYAVCMLHVLPVMLCLLPLCLACAKPETSPIVLHLQSNFVYKQAGAVNTLRPHWFNCNVMPLFHVLGSWALTAVTAKSSSLVPALPNHSS